MSRYRVTGTKRFKGHKPGEEFEADLNFGQEQRALDRGSIELIGGADLESQTRADLNARALAAGVDRPEQLSDKAAVISAIRDSEKE